MRRDNRNVLWDESGKLRLGMQKQNKSLLARGGVGLRRYCQSKMKTVVWFIFYILLNTSFLFLHWLLPTHSLPLSLSLSLSLLSLLILFISHLFLHTMKRLPTCYWKFHVKNAPWASCFPSLFFFLSLCSLEDHGICAKASPGEEAMYPARGILLHGERLHKSTGVQPSSSWSVESFLLLVTENLFTFFSVKLISAMVVIKMSYPKANFSLSLHFSPFFTPKTCKTVACLIESVW